MGDAQWTAGEASVNFDMVSVYSNFARSMADTLAVGCREPTSQAADTSAPPVDYQCCDFNHVTFGCSDTGTNFSSGTTGALPDVVPYSKKTYGGWPGDPSWQVASAIIPWEVWRRTGDGNIVEEAYELVCASVLTDSALLAQLVISGAYCHMCCFDRQLPMSTSSHLMLTQARGLWLSVTTVTGWLLR